MYLILSNLLICPRGLNIISHPDRNLYSDVCRHDHYGVRFFFARCLQPDFRVCNFEEVESLELKKLDADSKVVFRPL